MLINFYTNADDAHVWTHLTPHIRQSKFNTLNVNVSFINKLKLFTLPQHFYEATYINNDI